MEKNNFPVTIQVYLGSGNRGIKLKENLEKRRKPRQSMASVVVELLRKADPSLFKGVDNARS